MGDLIFVAVVVAFFAVTVAYVKGLERIVGSDAGVVPDVDPAEGAGSVPDVDSSRRVHR
jgi:hypothetical protein